ncbi:MAG: tRNA (adenosine(37)-N6)-threonylcarbamoyltransferase complex dimerization subunit type 1 TsaB, partial [Gemmobacter sp.]
MPPETVLAFDTSAAHCAAALLLPDGRAINRLEPMEKGQAERLMPMLAELLADTGLDWSGLTRIGVGTGPGNFTG